MADLNDSTTTPVDRIEDISVSLESVQSILEMCHHTMLGGTDDPRELIRVETALPLAIREIKRLGTLASEIEAETRLPASLGG